ncbi:MAG: NAD(P)/FAD-dependent oxidoreductase [Parvularculales bacterium]
MTNTPHHDIAIVGAGISGIGAACRFRSQFPEDSLAVIESRSAIGGTWDLFRYPGIRSDSDMLTLGYDFRPWVGDKVLADGPSIKNYVRNVADEHGITPYIQFNSKVTSLHFSSDSDLWTLKISDMKTGETREIQSRFVIAAAGYYKYDEGYTPHFEGRENFKGDIIHPQHWPENYDYSGKKIVVIGSGATAVTLVPEMSETAEHVTMLQRSPTYIASVPAKDHIGNFLRSVLPAGLAFRLARAKNIWLQRYMYKRTRTNPKKVREWFLKRAQKALGPDYPVDKHFTPDYNPWDQRVCAIPDGDLFAAIRKGRASVVTDHIDTFTEHGIRLKSGEELPADVIITATGLNVVFSGGLDFIIDGRPIRASDSFGYKGVMFSDIPNMITVFGYTNASWTLRADLVSRYAVRLIGHMKKRGLTRAVPVAPEGMPRNPWIDFQAGYLQRVMDQLPSQGDKHPWLNLQDYKRDQSILLEDPVDDGALEFSGPTPVAIAAE